jgi:hypothetical protein
MRFNPSQNASSPLPCRRVADGWIASIINVATTPISGKENVLPRIAYDPRANVRSL